MAGASSKDRGDRTAGAFGLPRPSTIERSATMELDVKLDREDDVCVVSLGGEVDVYTSPSFKERLVEAIDGGCKYIVVDLEGVDFIDSSGLGVLVSGLRRVKEVDGWVRIACTRDQVLKVFRITGLDRVFPIHATVSEARGR
jgi:anti-sigma B factor antagonist